MNMNTPGMKWISSFFAAALAVGCIGEPVDQETDATEFSPSGEGSKDDIQEPDTQATGIADQAPEVAQLHMKAEDGTEADFLLPDGSSVQVTNEQLGIAYRLTGKVIDADHLIVTVEQFNDIEMKNLNSSDILYLDQGKESHEQSAITPFSLRLAGMKNSTKGESLHYKEQGDPSAGTCCVTCGNWKVCCTPAPGKCCTVTSSCGNGCQACN